MQTLTDIKSLLAARGLHPKHALGQNYLHDHNQLRKLVAAAAVQPGSVVLEVGPGTGTLTETLLDAGARVVACELDRDMASIVEERNAHRMVAAPADLRPGTLSLLRADCLAGKHALNPALASALQHAMATSAQPPAAGQPAAVAPPATSAPTFLLVANLPYQAATPLMATLLEDHPACAGQYVTIQREVADRLTAAPNTAAYGPLSVTMGLLADVQLIGLVPPGCFWPAPAVQSAMVAVRPRAARPTPTPWPPFAQFVQRTFSQRRKQLGSILGRAEVQQAGFDPQRRPETLSPDEWVRLYAAMAPYLRA